MKNIIHADCIEAMRDMDPESVTAIITDPPYGLSFMGKEWDHGVPGVPFWTEALRVLKPVELMRWLVRLVTGPGHNLILDPFAGSGTTGVACNLEGVPFVLIEREAKYVEIINKRLFRGMVQLPIYLTEAES